MGVFTVIALVSWVLFLAEFFAYLGMIRPVYRFGVPVLRKSIDLPMPDDLFESVNGQITTAHGVTRRVDLDTAIFRRSFGGFSWHTPFPLKGTVEWHGRYASVTGRVSPLPALFFAGAGLDSVPGWNGVLLAVTLCALFLGLSLLIEIPLFNRVVADLATEASA